MADGGVFLASLRLGGIDTHADQWVYPDVAYFTVETLREVAAHAGFSVELLPEHRERMIRVAPNDLHDWVRFTATDAPRFHEQHADADICPLARAEKTRADEAEERERDLADVVDDLTATIEACFPLTDNHLQPELWSRARTSYERGSQTVAAYRAKGLLT